jgi:hypothetical protein
MKLEVARPLGLSVLAVAVFLILVPFLNVGLGVLPIRPAVREWRFGTWGLLLGALTLPTLGVGFLALGGVLRDSRGTLRVAAVVSTALGLMAAIGLVDFWAIGSSLRKATTEPRLQLLYSRELRRTAMISVLAIPALLGVAVASLALVKGLKPAKVGAQDTLMRASKPG